MSRPKSNRVVYEPPIHTEFKPVGNKSQSLEVIDLTLDEFEALRLADQMAMSHAEAADEMEISRSTFTRLIERARKKLADFIIQGKLLCINGGNVHFRNNIIKCQSCGHMFKMSFNETITECPVCKSHNLLNLAGGFGHGNCCRHRNKNN
ncbi:MAG TPA: DNA-binding protein [Bacteroidales bacterium]|nr:DNA-binding protein [Bacteroidales bacterium]